MATKRKAARKSVTSRSLFSRAVQRMILTGWNNDQNSSEIAQRINNSATARRLGESYTPSQIRTILGNITRGNCYWHDRGVVTVQR